MKLLSEVHVQGFRSIRNALIRDFGDFTTLAGLNNSGKSNLLRALNAFFNHETDSGQSLSLDKDYFRPDLAKKKAKRISIAVTFSLPDQFKFRKGLESIQGFLGSRSFRIRKEWVRSELLPSYYLNDNPKLELDDRQKIDQFLQLINFRYIPNRVQPIDVISKEHQALRDVLIRRLGKKAKGHEKAFESLHETSRAMIQALAKRFHDACPDAGGIRLATPKSWSDMLFAFGYRLAQYGVEIEDDAQGSGIQSLLMLETLYLIDRDYFQKFGWRQGAIWAVEEPESSLHSTLEARVASFLASASTDASSRLQVICTTHSDLMLQYSKKTIIAKYEDGQTTFDIIGDTRKALAILARAGISRWAHPILHYPLDPLVLVEGKYDYTFLQESLKYFRQKRPVRIAYLEQLTEGKSGGVEDLLRYVRENAQAIKSRQKDSQVIVVLDWDSTNKKEAFTKLFETSEPFKILVWPDADFNPSLGKSFHGIERYYSDRIIKEAEVNGVKVFRSADGICSIEKEDYGKAKDVCHEIIKEGLQPNDLAHVRGFIEVILRTAGALR